MIAAVEGPAFGGGMEIVLACDLVVASTTARFGLPEVKRGLLPTCAALFRGPQALPLNFARELILTGDPIEPARAYALGFVNVVTEPGEALEGALALAERIGERAAVGAGLPRRRQPPRALTTTPVGTRPRGPWRPSPAATT